MKNTIKIGIKIFGKIMLANILSIITVISLSFICSAMYTKNIGYYAYGTSSTSSESEFLYEYYYEDGEDENLTKYEAEGYKINTVNIRSQLSKTGNAVFLVLCAFFCISLAAMFCYSYVWKEGNKDLNLVRFGHAVKQKYKGLLIGFIAMAPYFVLLLVLTVGKTSFSKSFPVILYQYINSAFFAPIDIVFGKSLTFGDVAWWQIILLLLIQLLIPLFTSIAYHLGYKDILVSDKFIYKKQK